MIIGNRNSLIGQLNDHDSNDKKLLANTSNNSLQGQESKPLIFKAATPTKSLNVGKRS